MPRLTAVEVDLAGSLRDRLRNTNVDVVHADGTALPLDSDRFSAATTFATLHHVPSPELQDRLLGELCRVLRTGGLLVGSDSIPSNELDVFHAGDVYVPCDPETFPDRLRAAGFVQVQVDTTDLVDEEMAWARSRFRFSAVAS